MSMRKKIFLPEWTDLLVKPWKRFKAEGIVLKLASLKPNVSAEALTFGNSHCILDTATSNPIPPEMNLRDGEINC